MVAVLQQPRDGDDIARMIRDRDLGEVVLRTMAAVGERPLGGRGDAVQRALAFAVVGVEPGEVVGGDRRVVAAGRIGERLQTEEVFRAPLNLEAIR